METVFTFMLCKQSSSSIRNHHAAGSSITGAADIRLGGEMGSSWSKTSEAESEIALEKAKNIVKGLFKQLGVTSLVVELDRENDGAAIQAALYEWTGQRSVPNVFIGGQGGCDSTMELHRPGKLVPILVDAKAIGVTSS
ncbi:Glutaredoxin-like protein [Drosera capensis]